MLTEEECKEALANLWMASQSVRQELAAILADHKKKATKADVERWMWRLYGAEHPLLERAKQCPPDHAARSTRSNRGEVS
jgi:hypothetical protein